MVIVIMHKMLECDAVSDTNDIIVIHTFGLAMIITNIISIL